MGPGSAEWLHFMSTSSSWPQKRRQMRRSQGMVGAVEVLLMVIEKVADLYNRMSR